MPSFKQKVNHLQCIISVIIKSAKQDVKGFSLSDLEKYNFKALIDTGAMKTCVTNKLASELNLTSRGKSLMISATEKVSVNEYFVHLYIPIDHISPVVKNNKVSGVQANLNLKAIQKLKVQEMLYSPSNFDVLLGMDVLDQCNFILAHGEFILAY